MSVVSEILRPAPAMSVQLTPSFSGVLGSGSQPMQGGSLSVTVTVNEQVDGLPASSRTVHVTVVVPSPNTCPSSVVLGAVRVVLVLPLTA